MTRAHASATSRDDERPSDRIPELGLATREIHEYYNMRFIRWCASRGLEHAPASDETVLAFLGEEDEGSYWMARNRISAISRLHRAAGFENPRARPRIRAYLAGMPRRNVGRRAAKTRDDHVAQATTEVGADMRVIRTEFITGKLPVRMEQERRQIEALVQESLAPDTVRRYRYDFGRFARWCAGRDRVVLPATQETLVEYLFGAEDVSYATVRNRLSALAYYHRVNEHADPARLPRIKECLRALRRARPAKPKTSLLASDVRRMVARIGDYPLDLRDKAMTLVIFAAALRTEQLRALDRSRVEFRDTTVLLRTPDGDAFVVGRGAHDETCPARALQRWLEIIGTAPGPLFPSLAARGGFSSEPLSRVQIREVVFRLAQQAGIDPTRITTKSLRSGFMLSAAVAGVRTTHIMRQSGLTKLSSLLKHTKNVGEPYELDVQTRRDRRTARSRRES